jgi:hypothetical protein
MARQESDREDLLGEAVALVERIELAVHDEPASVVIGFRVNGAVSIYFGAAPVYQFNTSLQLRRAFSAEGPIKSEHGRLIQLVRNRTSECTELSSIPLSKSAQTDFLMAARERLHALCTAIADGKYQVIGVVPAYQPVLTRAQAWLCELPSVLTCADHAQVQ